MGTSLALSLFCSECGSENDAGSRFCRSCGSALAAPASTAEVRKVVTILFSDVAEFTALGEELDPESMRKLMARYFDGMSAVLRRHGGTVDKFIGDAIMGVFGLPRTHEDDALRAVRAALGMRKTLAGLNDDFERTFGVRILIRTGVNTGEVVSGGPAHEQPVLVGDAVNLASRLETACNPGEILLGETTYRLVSNAVIAEPLPPLELKGKRKPVAAWKLVDLVAVPADVRRLDSPLVGRERQRAQLEEAFGRVVQTKTPEVITLMGPAGVGKSRLAAEFLQGLDGKAQVVLGRCLPYGEGITFWPVVEMLRGLTGAADLDAPDEVRAKITGLLTGPDSALVGERLAALLGLAEVTAGVQETFWAVRKLFEERARHEPLVVVFNDIHWAEPTLLDLIEYLVDWLAGVPVLVLCLARPELFEVRGNWMSGKPNASLLVLPSLDADQVDGLIENLLGGVQLAAEARARIAEAAEGNPLYVEETLRMLVDDGLLRPLESGWAVVGDLSALTIPPTIQALLTARLDRLEDDERSVIQRASVIGRAFWWGAVVEISPDEQRARVGSCLHSLTRKELIRPDHSSIAEEDAFRFTHLLVCDAAYRGIPKAVRADLHELFAGWLEARSRDGVAEYEEILGYHLEQAFSSLAELGPVDERAESLGRRAAVPLASAGRRAFARGDMPAAVNLLSRAAALTPRGQRARPELLADLAFALLETGDFERLREAVGEASEAAAASSDRRLQTRVAVLGLWIGMFTDPEGWAEAAAEEATRAIDVFDELQDEHGLAKSWSLLGLFHLMKCQFGAAEEAWEQAADHAGAASAERERLESLAFLPLVIWGGPTPVEQAIARCRNVFERAAGDRKAMATARYVEGVLEAMRGRFPEARVLTADARAMLDEIALSVWRSGPFAQMAAWVELLAGDPAAAESELRPSLETLRAIGELSWLSTVAGILAEAVYAQGRYDEAEELVALSLETAGGDDAYSQALGRSVRAKVLGRRGEVVVAEHLAREAIEIAHATDFPFLLAFALTSLGETLQLAGKVEEAETTLAEARQVCEDKGFSVGADKVVALLAEA
jgi:class 3 adenylate cyclase/tetratricopeptide (TPR) repeat protein